MTKYIFITGGVMSSLGKGITAASLGKLLKSRGLKVTIQKIDPYINVDPGTMNPFQHGEVYVTDDGAETDLDLGHYERFLDQNLTQDNNLTSGRIYREVISKERKGEYLGATVQMIPHITDEIKERIKSLAKKADFEVVITEIGGTVGDIESLPFLEAIRQLKNDIGKENVLYMHVTFIPYIKQIGELKTKPTQHSVKELRSIGIQPDIIICRSDRRLSKEALHKIALFCDVELEAIINNVDVEEIYEVPLYLQEEGLDEIVIKRLNLESKESNMENWKKMLEEADISKEIVKIGLVGKYTRLSDAYLSVTEALKHAGYTNRCKVSTTLISAEKLLNKDVGEILSHYNGILVPGGFGTRGIEGKIDAIKYVRENKIPFLGICLGMQCAVIEFARNVAGLANANSSEFNPKTPHPVIDLLPAQKDIKEKGGTMRLGAYPCKLTPDTKVFSAYKKELIYERHRHRYEFNNEYLDILTKSGLIISGKSPDGKLVEMIELKDHSWFVAGQFHPEFKSRPNRAHPLFREFIKASLEYKRRK
jgi:CTP synthase